MSASSACSRTSSGCHCAGTACANRPRPATSLSETAKIAACTVRGIVGRSGSTAAMTGCKALAERARLPARRSSRSGPAGQGRSVTCCAALACRSSPANILIRPTITAGSPFWRAQHAVDGTRHIRLPGSGRDLRRCARRLRGTCRPAVSSSGCKFCQTMRGNAACHCRPHAQHLKQHGQRFDAVELPRRRWPPVAATSAAGSASPGRRFDRFRGPGSTGHCPPPDTPGAKARIVVLEQPTSEARPRSGPCADQRPEGVHAAPSARPWRR